MKASAKKISKQSKGLHKNIHITVPISRAVQLQVFANIESNYNPEGISKAFAEKKKNAIVASVFQTE
jgi:hypothetical protein